MLRDKYEPNPFFLSIVQQLAIEMEPDLAEIDRILEDDELFQMIKRDLSKHRPKTLETGRNSTPVEVIARMLATKRLYGLSYEQTERQVSDSLVLRWFCRVYFNPVLDHSNLNRWALLIQPDTLHAFNDRVTAIATEVKVTRGRKLRTDGTVVETNIHYPTDSSLLADGVRVLSRTIKRAKAILVNRAEMTAETFRDRTRSARNQARHIADEARKRGSETKADLKESYRRLVSTTKANVKQAKQVFEALREQSSKEAKRLADTLEQFIPRVEQVIEQTVRRVFEEQMVPAQEKIVSIFEPHTDIIRRNKAHKPTEFGHKVWLDEVDGGIVANYRVLDGNPPDRDQWRPGLEHHVQQFGKPPYQASGDRGVYSPENEAYATEIGVRRVILPKPGRKSATRRQHEQQRWFKRGRRFHVGVEGRISVLKRKHDLDRCLYHGEDGFERWAGWGVIAGNLAVIGATLAARTARC
jgi:IS5 family transposase